MSDSYYKTKRQEALGSISGWDVITTAEPDVSTHIPSNDSDYTLPDLYLQLKRLMDRLDPDQIEYLIKSIREHISDKENPHKVTLDKMNTNVVKELYKLWQQEGHTSVGDTEDQFLKQLFQYVQIANVEETLEGKSLDKVPSVYSVDKAIEKHNQDIDAHANLFEAVFPGEPLIGPPSYAVLGVVSQAKIPAEVEVIRNSAIYINNRFGELELVEANTIKPDWSYGEPALPIFDKYRQLVTSTEDFNHASYTKTNVTIDTTKEVIYSPRVKNTFVPYMCESSDSTEKEHSLTWKCPSSLSSGDDSNDTAEVIYTYSIYVYPVNREAFSIDISDCFTTINKYNFVGFNFDSKTTFISASATADKITSGMTQLASGWYRLWVTFATDKELKDSNIKLILNNNDDTDFTYKGNGLAGAYLFGAQLTNTPTVAPYVETSKFINATVVKIPVNSREEWFNTNASTIVAEVSNQISIQKDKHTDNIVNVTGTLTDGANILSAEIRYSQIYANPYFKIYNSTGSSLIEAHSSTTNSNNSDRSMIALAYDSTGIIYSSTDMSEPVSKEHTLSNVKLNENIKYIYLGSDMKGEHQLNGYMFGFIYYPFKCTKQNLKYFLEDPIYAVRR